MPRRAREAKHATNTPGRKCALKGCQHPFCIQADRDYQHAYYLRRKANRDGTAK